MHHFLSFYGLFLFSLSLCTSSNLCAQLRVSFPLILCLCSQHSSTLHQTFLLRDVSAVVILNSLPRYVYSFYVCFSAACPSAISLWLSVCTSLCLIKHHKQQLRTAGLNFSANLPLSLSLSPSLSLSLWLCVQSCVCVCVCVLVRVCQQSAFYISLVTHYLVSLH